MSTAGGVPGGKPFHPPSRRLKKDRVAGKLRDYLYHVDRNTSVESFLSFDLISKRGVEA